MSVASTVGKINWVSLDPTGDGPDSSVYYDPPTYPNKQGTQWKTPHPKRKGPCFPSSYPLDGPLPTFFENTQTVPTPV